MTSDYLSHPRPRLFGHRGAAGVAPENTLESFRRGLSDGAVYLELDVHATRDGVVVVIHDPTADRTTDGSGAVRDLTFDELRAFDAGARFPGSGTFPYRGCGVKVPSLEELLRDLPDVPMNIEIKQADPPIEREVANLLRRLEATGRVMLAAENDEVMLRIRAASPECLTSLSAGEVRAFFERFLASGLKGYRPPGRALQIPPRFGDIELVTADSVAAAHDVGLEVHVWTINEADEMERLLALGVDGLMSDFPSRLRDARGPGPK